MTYEFERFNNGYDFAKGYQKEGYEIFDKNRQKSGYEILRAGPGTWFIYWPGDLPMESNTNKIDEHEIKPEWDLVFPHPLVFATEVIDRLIGKGSLVDKFLSNWTTLQSGWISQVSTTPFGCGSCSLTKAPQLQLPEEEEEWSAQVCGNTLTIQSSFATPTQVLSCIIRGFLLIHFKI